MRREYKIYGVSEVLTSLKQVREYINTHKFCAWNGKKVSRYENGMYVGYYLVRVGQNGGVYL